MTPEEARRWVEKHFGNDARFNASENANIPDEAFVGALQHFVYLTTAHGKNLKPLSRFLYLACRRFDRWMVPSPPSVPVTAQATLQAFAAIYGRIETPPMNAPIFQVHALRGELYEKFAGRPLRFSDEEKASLSRLRTSLADILIPRETEKAGEVLAAIGDLTAIICELEAATLKTRLRTALPYPLTRCPIDFSLEWEGLKVVGRLTPTFAAPGGLLAPAPPNVIRPLSSTRWQFGTTTVQLDFEGLVDPSLQVPSLQIPSIELPDHAWPNGLRVAYEIIYNVCWLIRGHEEFIGNWVPAPADLSEIESVMLVAGRTDFAFIRRANPSMAASMFAPTREMLELNLGAVPVPSWHRRCRIQAEQYASFGETREAIFWLNVGVEFLIRSRMDSFIAASGNSIDLDVLDGGKTYWDEAKTLVASQFPDLAEEISWPSGGKKPSLFQQLKYFCVNVPGAPAFATAKTHYSKVSKNRNALFHGNQEASIPADEVRQALASFDWLENNFCNSCAASKPE